MKRLTTNLGTPPVIRGDRCQSSVYIITTYIRFHFLLSERTRSLQSSFSQAKLSASIPLLIADLVSAICPLPVGMTFCIGADML